jgi:hypothetical protein
LDRSLQIRDRCCGYPCGVVATSLHGSCAFHCTTVNRCRWQ